MKLFKNKVNKFRSVKNTEWVNIDDWACYVGVNESGKTNLLLPLWKFNPASEDAQLDLLYDYPQDEYAKLQNDDDPALSDEFINIIFSLGEEDKKNIIHIANNKSSEMEEVVTLNIDEQNFILASRNFKGEYYLYFCDENGAVTSEELESIVKIDKFNQLIKLLPKFIYYEDYGNLDSNLYLPDVISEINMT